MLRRFIRLMTIVKTLIRYRLDVLLLSIPQLSSLKPILYFLPWHFFISAKRYTRAQRLHLALQDLGTIFIKFGQVLSTRGDLLPDEFGKELSKLQDSCPVFSGEVAQDIVEQALGGKVSDFFKTFDKTPLASASIAQVHAATTLEGEAVVVKVVRPNIDKQIKRDLNVLYALVKLISMHPDGARLDLYGLVKEFERIILGELNMLTEAASASALKRNFAHSKLLEVPAVNWQLTRHNVLVMERIYGTPINQIDNLKSKGIDLKKLAEAGVEIFFTQVFAHNFFHADMHPGNIFVSDEGKYIALDFGIMGTLKKQELYYLAKNFMAFFNRDYEEVARIHLESGWIPNHINENDFANAIRSVCEPIFNKPLKDISFGLVLINLFKQAKKFDIQVQPQLFLLDKTLLNIEGLGRQLYGELDLWQTAKPFLTNIMAIKKREQRQEGLAYLKRELPRLPALSIEVLQQLARGEVNTADQQKLNAIEQQLKKQHKKQHYMVLAFAAMTGVALLLPLYGFSLPIAALTVLALWASINIFL